MVLFMFVGWDKDLLTRGVDDPVDDPVDMFVFAPLANNTRTASGLFSCIREWMSVKSRKHT